MRPRPVRSRREGRATPSTSQRRPSPQAAPERAEQLEAVQIVANSYCLRHYGIGYSGGTPRRLSFRSAEVWIVPALLTSPGATKAATVGESLASSLSIVVWRLGWASWTRTITSPLPPNFSCN